MNKIFGKVILRETQIGIPDLLIVVYDIDPRTKPEEPINVNPAAGGFLTRENGFPGDRIGSVLTDKNGVFEFLFEDEEFQIRNPKEKRPDLFLLVMSPEESSKETKSRILYSSQNIRQNAGRTEQYLIRLSTEQLKRSEISLPTETSNTLKEPMSIIHDMKTSIEQQDQIKTEQLKIATKKIAQVKARTQLSLKTLETRLLEKLTKIPAAQAEKLNYVMPNAEVEPTHWKTINSNIENKINPLKPNTAYIVIPNNLVPTFKQGTEFRDDIAAAEIEPFLFGSEDAAPRPSFLLREDPNALLCQSKELPGEFIREPQADTTEDDIEEIPTPAELAANVEQLNGQAKPEDVPGYIERLISTMSAPEESVDFGIRQRANQEDLEKEMSNFELRSGPADVPAFYDFYNLQIAFDYVWQQAIDEEVLETSNELYHQIIEKGGDPGPALEAGQDPIQALKIEALAIQRVYDSYQTPNVMYKDNANTGTPTGPGISNIFDQYRPDAPDHSVAKPPPKVYQKPHPLLDYLDEILNEDYSFTVFAPHSTNFGLLTTYRQKWDPINYQVGNLIKTIPLTPGEKREMSYKMTTKKERHVKEMENSLRINKNDSSDTSRAESEIVRKAEAKTNFSLNTTGSYSLGFTSGDVTSDIGKEAGNASQETKKAFREAVVKAAQEYKDERKIEIESKESFIGEETESTVIQNTNDELTVTYLFYELQRRYNVSEHIHRLTPVVLVAMEVPNPSRKSIDSLLLTHGWIIKRVLLDDSYRKPLMYISTRMVGEEIALQEMKKTLDELRSLVRALKEQQVAIREQLAKRYHALELALAKRADIVVHEDSEGWFESAVESVFGSGDEESLEGAKLQEEAAQAAHEKAAQDEKQMRARLEREVTALNDATQSYTKAYADHLNKKLEIGRLRVHIKKNILYYMQAIWSSTFQDQIFFELHKIKVPTLTSASKTYTLSEPNEIPANVIIGPDQTVLEVEANVTLNSNLDPASDFKTLAEVADLDSPLGFKGNYMIFPLKESNALTDYMMTPYVDSELGLHDPDELGNWTPNEFVNYVACLKENLEAAKFESIRGKLAEQYKRLLSSPRRATEEIIVPSGGIYTDAIVGAHPLIEDFKLLHRAIDVKKAQAEVREMELENVRLAARLLAEEREDPDIDKKIVVEGANGNVNLLIEEN